MQIISLTLNFKSQKAFEMRNVQVIQIRFILQLRVFVIEVEVDSVAGSVKTGVVFSLSEIIGEPSSAQ